MSEEQKAERRTVVADNRNWDSAEKVRRSWLADAFLTRTSPPKNAETFVALAVIHGERTEDYNSLYTTLTKAQSGYQATAALVSRAEAGTPRQALMLALALLVCEWESRTSRDTWRRPGERDRRYLATLVQWGYKPSDVEQLVLTPPAEATAEAVARQGPPRQVGAAVLRARGRLDVARADPLTQGIAQPWPSTGTAFNAADP